jgi:hypothetical protein
MSEQLYTKTATDVDLHQRKGFERLTTETRAAVERASIVLVPDEGFRDYPGPVFPKGTVDFLQYLKEHAPNGTNVAIAAEDADYKEVVLHSDIVRLATILVEYIAVPVATSLMAAYLWDLLRSRLPRAEARAAILIHRKDGAVEQTVRISYEGPASNLQQALTDAIATLPTRTGATPTGARTVTTFEPHEKAPKRIATKKKTKRRK